MTLSKAEIASARKAYRRIQFYEFFRDPERFGILLAGMALGTGAAVDGALGHDLLPIFTLCLLLLNLTMCVVRFYHAKKHHPEDIRLLEELRAKAGGTFPGQLDIPEDYSVLRLYGKPRSRAILWRFDRILSGKTAAR